MGRLLPTTTGQTLVGDVDATSSASTSEEVDATSSASTK